MVHRFFYLMPIIVLLFYPMQGAHAMAPQPSITEQPLTTEPVSIFINEFMQGQMAELHIPGAAIVVVQGDSVLFENGYGMADLAEQIPVTVNESLFRAGSISKLFTATAVMQLVEQGQIDLDADVNEYLQRFQLEPRFGGPVTVADLLLHTAGFDEQFMGMHVRNAEELLPLADFLRNHLPERYSPPGQLISYNDHGYTLAGLIVENVSGKRFDAYIDDHIFEPLQMALSTFTQPLGQGLHEQMVVGYRYDDNLHQPYELDFVQVGPAAALIGPPSEMAHFMIAHLNDGRFGANSILQPETVAEMHQIRFAHHPELRGRAYGFSEWRENGRRAIFHDGGNPGFMSRLFLLPDEGVGFYLVFNGDQYTSATRFHRRFTTEFLDEFFPQLAGNLLGELQPDDPKIVQEASFSTAGSPIKAELQLSGYYREIQGYSRDTMEKVASMMNQFPVQASDKQLAVFGRDYKAVAPLVFYNKPDESTVVFRISKDLDAGRESTHLFVGTGAYAKVPWHESKPVQTGLAAWFLLIFSAAIFGGIWWSSASALLRGSLFSAGAINAIFLVGFAVVLTQMDVWNFAYGPPLIVRSLLALPLIGLGITLLFMWLTSVGWQSGDWGWRARVYTGVMTVSLLAFPFFLNLWNLLGFRY